MTTNIKQDITSETDKKYPQEEGVKIYDFIVLHVQQYIVHFINGLNALLICSLSFTEDDLTLHVAVFIAIYCYLKHEKICLKTAGRKICLPFSAEEQNQQSPDDDDTYDAEKQTKHSRRRRLLV